MATTLSKPESRPPLDTHRAQKLEAVALLVKGIPVNQVAKTIGVSKNTIWNWNSRDEFFQNALDEVEGEVKKRLTDEAIEYIHEDLRANTVKANEILKEAMDSDDERIRVQVALQLAKSSGAMTNDVNVRVGVEQILGQLSPDTRQGD